MAAGSTDAVNGGQLFATSQAVAGNTAATTGVDGRVAVTETQIAGPQADLGATNTAVTNLTIQVAGNTTAIAGLDTRVTSAEAPIAELQSTGAITTLLAGTTLGAVQYSDPGAPTQPNGGTRTNHVTLVGADTAQSVALHNVAGGAVAAGSTDAVNGDQLFAVAATASNGVQYDRDAAGNRTSSVTLAGGTVGAPVTLANVAAGAVAAGSTQAVNGGQRFATDQVAQQAAALGANAVQYDAGRTSVSFGGSGAPPVTLRNIAPGTTAADAANVGQLQAGMQATVAQANSYADARVNAALSALDFDLKQVRREIGAGTSAALAAAALPQANEAGRFMVAHEVYAVFGPPADQRSAGTITGAP